MDRQSHPPGGIFDEMPRPGRWPDVSNLHIRSGMRDPGGGAEHYRDIELLRELKGIGCHLPGLGRILGIETGNAGKLGIATGVLLVLGGMAVGIIGADHHQSGSHSQIGQGHEWIRGHIQPHMLHGGGGPPAGPGGSCRHLQGHLLVHRPFHMQL